MTTVSPRSLKSILTTENGPGQEESHLEEVVIAISSSSKEELNKNTIISRLSLEGKEIGAGKISSSTLVRVLTSMRLVLKYRKLIMLMELRRLMTSREKRDLCRLVIVIGELGGSAGEFGTSNWKLIFISCQLTFTSGLLTLKSNGSHLSNLCR